MTDVAEAVPVQEPVQEAAEEATQEVAQEVAEEAPAPAASTQAAEPAVASAFPSVVAEEISLNDVRKAWRGAGFAIMAPDLMQSTRQHNLLTENALTSLAKNVHGLIGDMTVVQRALGLPITASAAFLRSNGAGG